VGTPENRAFPGRGGTRLPEMKRQELSIFEQLLSDREKGQIAARPRLLSTAIVVLAAACTKTPAAPPVHLRVDSVPGLASPIGPATIAIATCELPPENPPWPSKAARAADCPRPLNSDGTYKRSPDAPPPQPGRTALFRYDDFGPQAMVAGWLGMEWWSWEAGGSFEFCDAFDVRVVVYDGVARETVEARFPTVRGVSDYRVVSRADVVAHLDAQIAELDGFVAEGEHHVESLRAKLEKTRQRLVRCLPNPD